MCTTERTCVRPSVRPNVRPNAFGRSVVRFETVAIISGAADFDLGTSLLGLNWALYFFSYPSPSAQILPITKTTWGMKLYFIHWYKCDTGFTREVRVNLEFESSTWTETVQS